MKKIFRFIPFLVILIAMHINSQWVTVSSGGTKDLNGISFYQNWGYAVGDSGLIKKTVNGGSIWSTLPMNTALNINNVYTSGTNDAYFCGAQGYIYKTTNGGTNFITQTTGITGVNYYGIDFINSTTGLVTGSSRRFAYTANGGANWVTGQLNVPLGANLEYRAVDLYDSTTSYIASTDTLIGNYYYSYVHRSTNNGVSYTNILAFQIGGPNPFVHVQFINSLTGFAITDKGHCIKTVNGGSSWSYNIMNMLVKSAYFVDAVTGYACGTSGGLKKTTNGGVTWLWQNSPTTVTLSDITCRDSVKSISAGYDGTIVMTDNGGTYTSINQTGTEIPTECKLSQNYPNPFNPSTNISFDISSATLVKLSIYNILGMEVKVLADEYFSPGKYETQFNASDLPSGTYFYRLKAGDFVETKKMILIK
jgi:photosystem II stability/assembly factor-like uncharacterized protein